MEFIFPPAIWAAIIGVVFSAIFALLGIIFHLLKGAIDANEQALDEAVTRLDDVEQRVKTLFAWAFGNAKDTTDEGFAGDIQAKLSELNDTLERMEQREAEHHDEVVDRLDELILHLDDEDALEFKRDDIK